MNKDEITKFMFENGLLLIPSRQPLGIDSPPPPKLDAPDLPNDHPIVLYRDGKLSESALCRELGIQESQLLRYLVERGELFG
ncbi:MAG: hypothetical protein L3J84_03560 [Gammaproteobacteria bacterium]|nr:hypothetical protein [Gammaproteobacteria bacterium]